MPSFKYQIIRTRKFSGLSVTVHPEKGVVVKAPFWLPDIAINKFISDREEWITKHLSRLGENKKPSKTYQHGEKHLYFGKEHTLFIQETEVPVRTSVSIENDLFIVRIFEGHVGEKRMVEIREAILRMFLETGIGVLTEKVNRYCSLIGVDYSLIEIKKVSSIWGSCSPSNKLCFNRKLIMAPHDVVDYVVIHEVCHLVHRNHSSRFWGLVAKFDPQYKEHRRWLHRNHLLLTI